MNSELKSAQGPYVRVQQNVVKVQELPREAPTKPSQVTQNKGENTSSPLSPKLISILNKCAEIKKKFEDKEFPPCSKSLYIRPSSPPSSWPKKIEWKRLPEFAENPQMFVNGVEPGDVIQGALGDCWFLGALSAVATREKMLMNLIPQKEINEWGVYQFRFFKNGEWIDVIVDDYIPVYNGKPVFSCCLDPNEMWVILVEKAYAKLHKCYECLEGGSETYALVDLTGGAPETFDLESNEIMQNLERFWHKMIKFHDQGYLGGCAYVHNGGKEENNGKGILQNHAYGITDAREIDGTIKLIKLRNPWGQVEWTGPWSDHSSEWTPQLKKILHQKVADDGEFWMNFQDFVTQFNRFYFVRTFDGEWQPTIIRGEWKGISAGGCANFDTWKNNPQYAFRISEKSDIFVTLMQKDTKMEGNFTHDINIGFMLLKTQDLSKPMVRLTNKDVVNKVSFTSSREVSKKIKGLLPGNYIISPSTFEPNIETSFILRIYIKGNKPLTVSVLESGSSNSTRNSVVSMIKESPASVIRSSKVQKSQSILSKVIIRGDVPPGVKSVMWGDSFPELNSIPIGFVWRWSAEEIHHLSSYVVAFAVFIAGVLSAESLSFF